MVSAAASWAYCAERRLRGCLGLRRSTACCWVCRPAPVTAACAGRRRCPRGQRRPGRRPGARRDRRSGSAAVAAPPPTGGRRRGQSQLSRDGLRVRGAGVRRRSPAHSTLMTTAPQAAAARRSAGRRRPGEVRRGRGPVRPQAWRVAAPVRGGSVGGRSADTVVLGFMQVSRSKAAARTAVGEAGGRRGRGRGSLGQRSRRWGPGAHRQRRGERGPGRTVGSTSAGTAGELRSGGQQQAVWGEGCCSCVLGRHRRLSVSSVSHRVS